MMKFTMNAKDLKVMMEKGMAAINKKATLSTLTRLYFQIDKNGILKVLGTDMEHWAEVRTDNAYDTQPGVFGIDVDDIKIISKMSGEITLEDVTTEDMEVGKINNVTIEHTPTGKYFAVLNVDFEPQPMLNQGGSIGIDVGIKEFYSDSNENTVSNPKYLEKSMRKLIREQRKLSRKEKGSSNRNKQRIKVALVHEKITNQRNDFLQKQSTMLIRENQTICIEDLNVKNMMRNHKLAQHIGSASWTKFFDMLSYKATWYGNDIVKIPTMYPSSQTCSCCGYKNPLVKNLAIRNWECPKCQTKHDRDTNASINILNKGLQMQST